MSARSTHPSTSTGARADACMGSREARQVAALQSSGRDRGWSLGGPGKPAGLGALMGSRMQLGGTDGWKESCREGAGPDLGRAGKQWGIVESRSYISLTMPSDKI
ncbi:MAG: hypothetical protein PHQ34_12895 [Methanothrix sp.]|nr:hypothetical protein [Methanothrix sp.]